MFLAYMYLNIYSQPTLTATPNWIALEAATRKSTKRALMQVSRLKFVVTHLPS